MATIGSERNPPVLLQTAEPLREAEVRLAPRPEPKFGMGAIVFAGTLSLLWIGAAVGYMWGFFSFKGLASLDVQ
jgi:hypothetical protein